MTIADTYKSSGTDATMYGFARNPNGKLGQTLYERRSGMVTLYWTGKVYRTLKEAEADSAAVNRAAWDAR